MEIVNKTSKILIERTDNGVVVLDIDEENVVVSRVAYEIYFKDGLIDFENIAILFLELMEMLKIPTYEAETNSKLELYVDPIDPEQEMEGKEIDEDPEDE
jgi:hypothetical protein